MTINITSLNIFSAQSDPSTKALISDEARLIYQWIIFIIFGEAISLFGTVTNIINIICFVKQGFKDPVNVSLLGLAMSDLASLVTVLWTNISCAPSFYETDLPFDTLQTQYLISGWPHVIFTRVTSWITALITLERCLCITVPLKVKNIFTPRRMGITIVFVFIILIGGSSPVYYTTRFGMVQSPLRNTTVLGLVYTKDRARIDPVLYIINNVFSPFLAFLTIITCTVILVVKLMKKARWRAKCTASMNIDATSERDQKIAQMVVMISILFIACFIPASVIFMAMAVEPELSLGGKYENMLFLVYGLGLVLESTNSSMNIFIYYHMSTKFRNTIQQFFACEKNKD